MELSKMMTQADTLTLHDEEQMRMLMTELVKLLPVTDSVTTEKSLSYLFTNLKDDEKGLDLVIYYADMFLNHPSSPVRDESRYISFMTTLLSTDSLPESVRVRGEESVKIAKLNRPGTKATDFRFEDRKGIESSILSISSPYTLLVFFDPECTHCSEILEELEKNISLRESVESGKLIVQAIYAEGKRDVWEKNKNHLPQWWRVGYDITGILDNDLYNLPAMPTLYLLDSEKNVILKDPDPRIVLEILSDL